jgi:hypothetical protein
MSEDMAHHVSGDLTELQKALLGTQTVEQFLQEVALLAARLVPDGRPGRSTCCGARHRTATPSSATSRPRS